MTKGPSFPDIALVFARGILDKAHAIRRSDLSKFQTARLRESIAVDLRKLTDIAIPAVRSPLISSQAQDWATSRGIDLSQESWQSQPRFDPGREILHYEHWSTIGDIRRELERADDVSTVLSHLARDLKIAWITKQEDRALTELGYSTKRPDPAAAYSAAGIEIVVPGEEVDAPRWMHEPTRDPATEELRQWLGDVLQREIAYGWTTHEAHCLGVVDNERCNCRLGIRLREDATTKMRLLSRASLAFDEARLWETATYLAFPYRDHPGYRTNWQPE